jgi:hypothetical protein
MNEMSDAGRIMIPITSDLIVQTLCLHKTLSLLYFSPSTSIPRDTDRPARTDDISAAILVSLKTIPTASHLLITIH